MVRMRTFADLEKGQLLFCVSKTMKFKVYEIQDIDRYGDRVSIKFGSYSDIFPKQKMEFSKGGNHYFTSRMNAYQFRDNNSIDHQLMSLEAEMSEFSSGESINDIGTKTVDVFCSCGKCIDISIQVDIKLKDKLDRMAKYIDNLKKIREGQIIYDHSSND